MLALYVDAPTTTAVGLYYIQFRAKAGTALGIVNLVMANKREQLEKFVNEFYQTINCSALISLVINVKERQVAILSICIILLVNISIYT